MPYSSTERFNIVKDANSPPIGLQINSIYMQLEERQILLKIKKADQ